MNFRSNTHAAGLRSKPPLHLVDPRPTRISLNGGDTYPVCRPHIGVLVIDVQRRMRRVVAKSAEERLGGRLDHTGRAGDSQRMEVLLQPVFAQYGEQPFVPVIRDEGQPRPISPVGNERSSRQWLHRINKDLMPLR